MRTKLIFIILLLSASSFATRRYWVGGGSAGNWNSTGPTNWSATSGGSNNASVPSTSPAYDSVYFDGVGATANANCTVSATAYCQILNLTGYTGTLSGSSILRVYGLELTIGSGATLTQQPTLYATSGTFILRSNGATMSNLTIGASASTAVIQLYDNFTQLAASTLTLAYGTFDLNGKTATVGIFSSNNANTRGITSSQAGGLLTIIGTGATPYTVAGGGTFTVANTTNWSIKIMGGRTSTATATYAFGGLAYGSINFEPGSAGSAANDSNRTYTIADNNTWNQFKLTTPRKYLFTDGTTQTCSSFVASGTASLWMILRGSSTGGWILVSSTAVCSQYLKLSYSTGTGTFNAGVTSANNGGNSGWSFTDCLSTIPQLMFQY